AARTAALPAPVRRASADAAVDAVNRLADAGARLLVIPVWPDGLDPKALEETAKARHLSIMTAGWWASDHVYSLRPDPAVEAKVAADHIVARKAQSTVIFVSHDPSDDAFASALRKALGDVGIQAPVL